MSQNIGYKRISTGKQNPDRQLDGLKFDRVFTDVCSGTSRERPALNEMIAYVRFGDSITVHSMDRLARNVQNLKSLVDDLTHAGVTIKFLKEGLMFTKGRNHLSDLMLSILGSVAEFERELIRERQREGIEKAKDAGKYKGRSPALTPSQIEDIQSRFARGESKASLARAFGVCRQTLYKVLKVHYL